MDDIFYHPGIDADAATNILLNTRKNGSFLVRDSESCEGAYCLGIYHDGLVTYYRIFQHKDHDNNYYIENKRTIQYYRDVPSLIQDYIDMKVDNGMKAPLLYPVPKTGNEISDKRNMAPVPKPRPRKVDSERSTKPPPLPGRKAETSTKPPPLPERVTNKSAIIPTPLNKLPSKLQERSLSIPENEKEEGLQPEEIREPKRKPPVPTPRSISVPSNKDQKPAENTLGREVHERKTMKPPPTIPKLTLFGTDKKVIENIRGSEIQGEKFIKPPLPIPRTKAHERSSADEAVYKEIDDKFEGIPPPLPAKSATLGRNWVSKTQTDPSPVILHSSFKADIVVPKLHSEFRPKVEIPGKNKTQTDPSPVILHSSSEADIVVPKLHSEFRPKVEIPGKNKKDDPIFKSLGEAIKSKSLQTLQNFKKKLEKEKKKSYDIWSLTSSNNMTLFTYACHFNSKDVVALLLQEGANPDKTDANDMAGLHYASASGDPDLIQLLIMKGASVNQSGAWNKNSPLHFAAANLKVDNVDKLIQRGADVTLVNKSGKTALNIVEEKVIKEGQSDMIDSIIEKLLKHSDKSSSKNVESQIKNIRSKLSSSDKESETNICDKIDDVISSGIHHCKSETKISDDDENDLYDDQHHDLYEASHQFQRTMSDVDKTTNL